MRQDENDKLFRYGELVWHFANGKTTDDTLTTFFQDLQSAFNFSKKFPHKAIQHFPTKQMTIGSLSTTDNIFLELLFSQDKIKISCNRVFGFGGLVIENYDPKNSILTISEIDGYEPISLSPKLVTFSIAKEDIESFVDSTHDVNRDTREKFKTKIKTFIEVCHKIEEFKSEPFVRYEELEKMAKDYENVLILHDYINETQKNIKGILSEIIKSNNVYKSKGFKNILSQYNKINREYIADNHNKLVLKDSFLEDEFYKSRDYKNIFNAPISFCLIEYLKNPDFSGKERITICEDCKCFFGKVKLNDRQKYCPGCSRKNHTPKDIQARRTKVSREATKKRQDKEKRKAVYEKEYKRLIEGGYSKEEAAKLANSSVIEQMRVIE